MNLTTKTNLNEEHKRVGSRERYYICWNEHTKSWNVERELQGKLVLGVPYYEDKKDAEDAIVQYYMPLGWEDDDAEEAEETNGE